MQLRFRPLEEWKMHLQDMTGRYDCDETVSR
jgi:hypothetical protein